MGWPALCVGMAARGKGGRTTPHHMSDSAARGAFCPASQRCAPLPLASLSLTSVPCGAQAAIVVASGMIATRMGERMYRQLDPDRIIETCGYLKRRIEYRFPGSGLVGLADAVHGTATSAAELSRWLARPMPLVRT